MTDRNIIGQKIAELRRNKGMTQAELADKLGVSHQAVSQWERSETLPDILTLPLIAEIFGENIATLLGIEEVKKEKTEEPEPIPVDIDKLMDEGEKNKATVEVNNLGDGSVFINGKKRDTSSTQLDVKDFSLPKSKNTIDLAKDSDYEIAVIQDGKIIKKFQGDPDDYIRIILVGECRDLHSEMSVEVQGNVKGDIDASGSVTVSDNVGGDIDAGGSVSVGGSIDGDVDAGGSVSVGGDVKGDIDAGGAVNMNGFGSRKNTGRSEKISSNESDADISVDGMTVTIKGDYNGDLSTAANVNVEGDVHGSVTSEQCVTVGGEVEGDVNAGTNMTVAGDVGGDVDAGTSVTVGGDIDGDVDAGNSVTAGGDINGDVDAGSSVTSGGDINGDVEAGGKVTAENGDINGDVSTSGDVKVGGDVNGDIRGKSITVEGDYNG